MFQHPGAEYLIVGLGIEAVYSDSSDLVQQVLGLNLRILAQHML